MKLLFENWRNYVLDEAVLNEASSPRRMAWDIYQALEGMGTDYDAVESIFKDIDSPATVKAVSDEFDKILKAEDEDPDDGDLAQWLYDDGMEDYAQAVRDALKSPEAHEAPEEETETAAAPAAKSDPKSSQLVSRQVQVLEQALGSERVSQMLGQIILYLSKQAGGEK